MPAIPPPAPAEAAAPDEHPTPAAETASATYDPRLYIRIATDLRGKLRTKAITAGTPLPITDLTREWGASRETVRKALRTLENDGLIRRYPHYGYRVLPPADTPATERTQPGATPAQPPTRSH
jgi:DNA-binding GntR family transcriptional regulator